DEARNESRNHESAKPRKRGKNFSIMATLNERLSFGWSLYQGGNAAQAEQVYREVLQDEPGNADVWCLLGIICRAQGHGEDAVASYQEAIRLKPHFLEGYNNLGNAFV